MEPGYYWAVLDSRSSVEVEIVKLDEDGGWRQLGEEIIYISKIIAKLDVTPPPVDSEPIEEF